VRAVEDVCMFRVALLPVARVSLTPGADLDARGCAGMVLLI
jgi:hypothetical protein